MKDRLDTHPCLPLRHGVLIHLVLVKLLTRHLRADIGDEVLDDLDSLLFFEYETVDVRGRMVARQKPTKIRV